MTTIKDILNYIETIAPLSSQASWDNSGLLVGDENKSVSKVLISLDITKDVVVEAKKLGCELIISHHPVIFSPLTSISSDQVVCDLIKADIAALCLHTNLDIADGIGVNAQLAKALKLQDTVLYKDDFLCVGKLKKALTDIQFASYVKDALSCKGVLYTNGNDIKTVAVSSGGGGDAILLKEKYNFDAVVTGEIKHHLFLYAQEHSMCVVQAGHHNTEDVVISPLADVLSKKFCEISFIKSSTLSDVVNFI